MITYPVIFKFKTRPEMPVVVKDGGDCHMCALKDDLMTCDYQFPYCAENDKHYVKATNDDLCDNES